MKRLTTQEKISRALSGAAWSQKRLQHPDIDETTKELHQDNLERHLADAKRLQKKQAKENNQ